MAVLTFLVIWVGFASWSWVLAEKRGLAPVPHAILGFFLGPIGVLITALRKPDHEALAQRPSPVTTAPARRGCPRCGNGVPNGNRACPTCGHRLTP